MVIRGVPQETFEVRNNWFVKQSESAQAVRGSLRTIVSDNAYGPEPKVAK